MKQTFPGSCHCGAVGFECELDLAAGTTRCNCGFCHKARFWMALVRAADFRLVRGADAMSDYQHTPRGRPEPFLHLNFCRRCGIRPFSKGGVLPELGGEFYAVNIACLDGVSDEELARAPVRYVDGRNDDWAATPAEHRYL